MNDSAVLWTIIGAGQRIQDKMESALADSGLSLAKLNALRHLVEADAPMSLGQLAEKIACVKSNVTQLVDRLENDGLVKRLPDPSDRRSVLASVTDEGRARFASGNAALVTVEADLIAQLPSQVKSSVSSLSSFAAGTKS